MKLVSNSIDLRLANRRCLLRDLENWYRLKVSQGKGGGQGYKFSEALSEVLGGSPFTVDWA